MPFYGAAILCVDDPGVRAIMPMVSRPVVSYGLGEDAQVRAVNVQALPGGRCASRVQRRNGVAMPDLADHAEPARRAQRAQRAGGHRGGHRAGVARRAGRARAGRVPGVGRRFQRYGDVPARRRRAASR
jgi:UDP-N-acetylmuramate--alanine ligase